MWKTLLKKIQSWRRRRKNKKFFLLYKEIDHLSMVHEQLREEGKNFADIMRRNGLRSVPEMLWEDNKRLQKQFARKLEYARRQLARLGAAI